MIQIPFDPSVSSSQKFRLDLDGLVCMFEIYWNIRDAAWYMDISADDKTQTSVRINPNQRLLITDRILGIQGNFFCLNDTGTENNISFDNFGSDWFLYWFNADELAEVDS